MPECGVEGGIFCRSNWHRLCLLRRPCCVAEPKMCGIAGLLSLSGQASEDDLKGRVDRMTQRMRHRGPDADGHWRDPQNRCHLGHRRLAILDLSDAGRQPMLDASGRYAITYNGEI